MKPWLDQLWAIRRDLNVEEWPNLLCWLRAFEATRFLTYGHPGWPSGD